MRSSRLRPVLVACVGAAAVLVSSPPGWAQPAEPSAPPPQPPAAIPLDPPPAAAPPVLIPPTPPVPAPLPAATAQVATSPRPAEPDQPPRLPVRLALQTESASGKVIRPFKNQLTGVRLDLQFSDRVSFGGYLGAASLQGKQGRVQNVLPYAQVEYMAGRDLRSSFRFPLRFASGYLPNNGPVVRAAAGLAYRVTPSIDLISELLTPMVWLTNNQMLLSMNVSLELAIRL